MNFKFDFLTILKHKSIIVAITRTITDIKCICYAHQREIFIFTFLYTSSFINWDWGLSKTGVKMHCYDWLSFIYSSQWLNYLFTSTLGLGEICISYVQINHRVDVMH